MAQATGRCICHKWFRRQSEVDDVVALVKNLYAGRVKFHDGEGTVAPGVTVHLVGGHTGGLQIVRVHTSRGAVVLASDTVHYWMNLAEQNPFPPANVMDALEAFRKVEDMVEDRDHIIPGHDPLVLSRFPPLRGNLDIVRVDLAPSGLMPITETIEAMKATRRGEVVTVGSLDGLVPSLNKDD
jgi:glyoxylase-like metal-dependent hydrolase (beta-lactamase superfamily II)